MVFADDVKFCPEIETDLGLKEKLVLTWKNQAKFIAHDVFGAADDGQFASLIESWYSIMQRRPSYAALMEKEDVEKKDPIANGRLVREQAACKQDARIEVKRQVVGSKDKEGVDALFECANFGHDIPVWLLKGDPKIARRVFLVSQDPLRDSGTNVAGNVYLSSPFGVHCSSYVAEHFATRLIEGVMNLGNVLLYVTDGIKFFTRDVNVMALGIDNQKRKRLAN